MTWFQALILGAIQGATEFLPISSSAHLVLIPWLLGWEFDAQVLFPFSVVLHWGTLLAVVVAFWNDLVRVTTAAARGLKIRQPLGTPEAQLAWLLLLASIPAALAGLLLGDLIREVFARPGLVAILLLVNAALLMLGERWRDRRRAQNVRRGLGDLGAKDAIVVGLAQMLALFPGISRSGSTIVGGLSRGFIRLEATRFALLLAVPIMLGAGVVAIADLSAEPTAQKIIADMVIGFLSAAVVGVVAIRWMLRYLSGGSLRAFAAYCAVVGFASLMVGYIRA